jgi:hypothetical protein
MADPATVANALGKPGHPSKHFLHVTGHVMAVDGEGVTRGGSQRHMENGTVFGGVDSLAAEHPLDAAAEIDLLREFYEQPERVIVEELLGKVEIEPAGLGRETLATAGICGKHRSQRLARRQVAAFGGQAGPGGKITQQQLRHDKSPKR